MSTWQDLVTAALIGTERTGVPAAAVAGLPVPADASGDPAVLLLDRAALLTVVRRGGRPADRPAPPPAAEPDPAPVVSPAAGRRLARMLGGTHADLLTEWLSAAVARGRRVPAHLLPALLDQARRVTADPELRRLAAEAGGARARWLAGLNPDWKFVTARAPTGDEAWRLGSASQRRGYLTALRARDPAAARELIAGSWAAATPDERLMFVNVLAAGLSLADEPLLEIALDHGNAFARKRAAEVLAALPGSALGRRMAERTRPCLRLDRHWLHVSPPAECDPAMRRDGITPRPGAEISPLAGRARLLLELMARTPLRTWTDGFGMTPAEIVCLRAGDWATVLLAGWSRAAIAQSPQDRGAWDWLAALINRSLAGGLPAAGETLNLPDLLAQRADPALGAPGALPDPPPDAPPVYQDVVRVLRFRYHMLKELDHDSAG